MNQCKNLREGFLRNRASFGFETVASTEEKVEFAKKAVDNGYGLDFIYVTVKNPDICLERIETRVARGGHNVDPDKVRKRYWKSLEFLHRYIELAENVSIYDNSGFGMKLIFSKKNGICVLLVNPKNCNWVSEHILAHIKGVVHSY